jgi:hypothetical protein
MKTARRSCRLAKKEAHNTMTTFASIRVTAHIVFYLDIREVVMFSAVTKQLRNCIHFKMSELWHSLIKSYFPKEEYYRLDTIDCSAFRSLAVDRIWDWNIVFSERVYWSRVGFTLSGDFEELSIFGCSFSSRDCSNECSKLENDFDEWDDGHCILFQLSQGYFLSYEVNNHTMGTWRLGHICLETGTNVTYVIDRLDGHPMGPGFSYLEAKSIVSFISKNCELTFNKKFLWPMFFPAVAMGADMEEYLPIFVQHVRDGLICLELDEGNWEMFQDYFQRIIDFNKQRNRTIRSHCCSDEADACFINMMKAIETAEST